jgi:hypothetical protein
LAVIVVLIVGAVHRHRLAQRIVITIAVIVTGIAGIGVDALLGRREVARELTLVVIHRRPAVNRRTILIIALARLAAHKVIAKRAAQCAGGGGSRNRARRNAAATESFQNGTAKGFLDLV